LKIDVKKWNADFLCTNSYKWLMGGYGGGVFYMKKKWISKFRSSSIGWRSMQHPEFMDNQKIEVKPEASRYEFGCPSFPSIFAVGAAVDYLSGIGMEKIENRILELTDFAVEGLQKKGFKIISPLAKKHRSGIIVFKVKNPQLVCKRLLGKGIYVSARGAGIRIAPHFYNSHNEIEMFLTKLLQSTERE
jgi:cysteine desulfurase / selenocysteine lyase